jgi:hypothetical protein
MARDMDRIWMFHQLPAWHQCVLRSMLNATFPGQEELRMQILASHFRIVDKNQSLSILPDDGSAAPVVKTIPVEASAADEDGVPIQLLLFTRHGFAYMLEIIRADGQPVKQMPQSDEFVVMVLGT